jgi:hypothetical protein
VNNRRPLGRVSVPTEMIAEVRKLAKLEHATLTEVVRRALQKEIYVMRRRKRGYETQPAAANYTLR